MIRKNKDGKMRNMKNKQRQKTKKSNMKYEAKAFCDFVNLKYENFNGQKTLLVRVVFSPI